jgi:hypothetical protein
VEGQQRVQVRFADAETQHSERAKRHRDWAATLQR